MPHDMKIIHETPVAKWEVCQRCNMKRRYNKGYKGRVDNVQYLKDHVRSFAQKNGPTRRVYKKVYQPEKCTIVI